MNILQRRFKAVIERLGEIVTLPGGVGKALVAILGDADARTYLLDADITAKPVRALYVPFDDTTSTTDSVALDGQTLSVVRVVELRYQAVTAVRMLVCV